MSEPTPSALVEALEARADYWEGKCNRLNYGACQTVACMKRGGWKRGEAVDHDVATCETYEACNVDRAAAAFIRSTMEAVEPFAREVRRNEERAVEFRMFLGWSDDTTVPIGWPSGEQGIVRLGDLRRLRRLTGATDER